MATIRIHCPACAAELEIDERHVGQEVECGSCLQTFVAEAKAKKPYRMRREAGDDEGETRDRPRRRRQARRDDDDDYDYTPPRRRAWGDTTFAIIALVLGIVSFPLACCCSALAIPVQIGGVVCGSIGMRRPEGKGMALAGLLLSLASLVLTIGLMAVGIGLNLANLNNPGQWNRGP